MVQTGNEAGATQAVEKGENKISIRDLTQRWIRAHRTVGGVVWLIVEFGQGENKREEEFCLSAHRARELGEFLIGPRVQEVPFDTSSTSTGRSIDINGVLYD